MRPLVGSIQKRRHACDQGVLRNYVSQEQDVDCSRGHTPPVHGVNRGGVTAGTVDILFLAYIVSKYTLIACVASLLYRSHQRTHTLFRERDPWELLLLIAVFSGFVVGT